MIFLSLQVNNGDWELGNYLCDAWVAADVMGCTGSILNLAAISVDRYGRCYMLRISEL